MGEGWGEGEYNTISTGYIPLPFVPSHQGRENPTFYEFIKFQPAISVAKIQLYLLCQSIIC